MVVSLKYFAKGAINIIKSDASTRNSTNNAKK